MDQALFQVQTFNGQRIGGGKKTLQSALRPTGTLLEEFVAKKITDYQEYLDDIRIPLRLACKTESGWPMVVSLWFLFKDGALYCATQESARIVSYLRAHPECAFEIASDLPPYCGVRGQARAVIDDQQGVEVLEKLIDRYIGDRQNSLAKKLLDNQKNEVAIILKPINIFAWDFSLRMKNINLQMKERFIKSCP